MQDLQPVHDLSEPLLYICYQHFRLVMSFHLHSGIFLRVCGYPDSDNNFLTLKCSKPQESWQIGHILNRAFRVEV